MRRFYGESLEAVMKYTLRQLIGSLQEMPVILKMEMGDEKAEQEKPLTGAAGFEAIKRMIPRGMGRRK